MPYYDMLSPQEHEDILSQASQEEKDDLADPQEELNDTNDAAEELNEDLLDDEEEEVTLPLSSCYPYFLLLIFFSPPCKLQAVTHLQDDEKSWKRRNNEDD